MQSAKKRWLSSGLVVPAGTALVRRAEPPKQVERLLVVGHVALEPVLSVPLASMAKERDLPTHLDFRRGFLRDWIERRWLQEDLVTFRPTVVFVAHNPIDAFARQMVRGLIRKVGAREIWMVPPGIGWRATKNFCPAFDLSVEGVASWVARAFAMVD